MERNKIYCMDCLDGLKNIENNSIDVILADPPYGIDYQSARRTDKSLWKPKIANDCEPFVEWLPEAHRILKEGGRLLCFYRWDVQDAFYCAMVQAGFTVRSQIVWDKVIHGMGDLHGEFAPCHELIMYATKGRYEFKGKRPKTVFRCNRVNPEKLIHPNEKPVKLICDLLNSISVIGESVLVPFVGSGVDIEACIRTHRNYVGFELDEHYYSIAQKRLMPWIGQERLF